MSINREAFVSLSPPFCPPSNIIPSLRLALSLCEGKDYSGIKNWKLLPCSGKQISQIRDQPLSAGGVDRSIVQVSEYTFRV